MTSFEIWDKGIQLTSLLFTLSNGVYDFCIPPEITYTYEHFLGGRFFACLAYYSFSFTQCNHQPIIKSQLISCLRIKVLLWNRPRPLFTPQGQVTYNL